MYDHGSYFAKQIQPNILAAIDRYFQEHCPTGGFLRAVMENDLFEAIGRADETNLTAIHSIVGYIYNETPFTVDGVRCRGNAEIVKEWLLIGAKLRAGTD